MRYAHTNLIARDWQKLAAFYIEYLGCVDFGSTRDLQGEKVERGSGVPGAHLTGVHLRLPGYGESGPTLELFSYEPLLEGLPSAPNRPGYGHLAFEVEDVEALRARILAAGGRAVGDVVHFDFGPRGAITWCYVTDPEDNIVELQKWEYPS